MRTRIGFLMAAVLMMGVVGESRAQADAATSDVPNVRVAPGGGLIYEVTLNDAGGLPVPFTVVDLVWPPATAALTCFCAGTPLLSTAVTGPDGVATFDIAAGGCINPAVAGTGVDVFAAGVFLITVGQVSPDFVDAAGVPVPNCSVSLSDAVTMTLPFATGTYSFCTDLNSDLAAGLEDAILATPFVLSGATCAP